MLGIDPAANVARAAEERGVPTLVEFFGVELAERLVGEGRRADLVLGNNVLAQVPDINDFVGGVAILLAPGGDGDVRVPAPRTLLEGLEYDTIYHEHFSYFSLTTIGRIFAAHGLRVIDVEELPSHGGSLRVYAAHEADAREDQSRRFGSSSPARTRRACAIRAGTGGSPRRSRSRSAPCSSC